jgi:hypothetical protein
LRPNARNVLKTQYYFYEYYSRISFNSPIFYVFWNDNKSNLGLRTDHIVKMLQLEGVGRKTAFKICDIARNESIKTDSDLLNLIQNCVENKRIPGLSPLNKDEILKAFQQGERILELSNAADIKILSVYDNGFPISLKVIRDKPIVLNFIGNY